MLNNDFLKVPTTFNFLKETTLDVKDPSIFSTRNSAHIHENKRKNTHCKTNFLPSCTEFLIYTTIFHKCSVMVHMS